MKIITQLSPLLLCSSIFLLNACKPIQDHADDKSSLIQAQCIASQSQCEVGNEVMNFSVKFYQQQLGDKITAETPVFIELIDTENSYQTDTSSKTEEKSYSISSYLEGRDMFMGKVPVFFEKGNTKGRFLAETLLASCVEDEMVWRLWLTVEQAGKAQTFFVDFTSIRP